MIEGGAGNTIRGNSIHDNVGLGIDLAQSARTPNDEGDGDAGANALQNFPVLESVTARSPRRRAAYAGPGPAPRRRLDDL